MKQKQRKHLYESKHRKASIRMWLKLVKAWRYEYQLTFGIVKNRHRRSVTARMMNQICGYTAFREEAHKRRLFVYHGGAE